MSRKFIGLVAALSIAVTGFSAVPARAASDQELARILAGIVVLGTVAHALDRRDNRREVQTHSPRHDYRQDRPRRYDHDRPRRQSEDRPRRHRAAVIPAYCVDRYRVRDGRQRIVNGACARDAMRNIRHIPRQCFTRVETRRGRVIEGYSPSCLRDSGFQIARNR